MAFELTFDLVEKILSCVPARSLVRLRCTCKQWETLISNPRFVKKHLSHMRCREQQFTVFYNEHMLSPLFSCGISYVGIDFNKPEKFDWKLPFSIALATTSNISHCDGLLLYVSRSRLLVSNPMFKQERWIKYSQQFDDSKDVCGLGYISNRSSTSYHDYKVVRFRCGGRTEDSSRVEVYSFNSDSWKVVVVDKNFDGFCRLPSSSVCLRGTPYWLGYKKDGNNTLLSIQSFDFLKERFEPLFLPSSSIDESLNLERCQTLGIYRGDHLSLLLECHETGKINLWVMRKQHWSRQMTVDAPQSPIHGHYFSSFIERNGRLALFITESEQISIYIVGENQDHQKIGYFSTGPERIICDCGYVPSLLQVPDVSEVR